MTSDVIASLTGVGEAADVRDYLLRHPIPLGGSECGEFLREPMSFLLKLYSR